MAKWSEGTKKRYREHMKAKYEARGWKIKTGVENVAIKDPWIHRSTGMSCGSCMWFCNFRCRKHAPTMTGYPAVFKNDWCGDHKLDKVSMGGE